MRYVLDIEPASDGMVRVQLVAGGTGVPLILGEHRPEDVPELVAEALRERLADRT
ncbi:MAG: hypothetical protein PGN33_21955 [Methylobacterium radiotolerans]